jgi:hypothetical protein
MEKEGEFFMKKYFVVFVLFNVSLAAYAQNGFQASGKEYTGNDTNHQFLFEAANVNSVGSSFQQVENLIGVWEGSYVATQGETGLTLTVAKESGVLHAIFKFYNLSGRTNAANGSYYMNITCQSGKYTFRGYEWIEQPSGYGFLDLEGTVDLTGNILSGTTIVGPGSNHPFTLVRKESGQSSGE